MLSRARRDNRQADTHEDTACDKKLTSAPFIDHAQSANRGYHHDWCLQGIEQQLSVYTSNTDRLRCKFVSLPMQSHRREEPTYP